MEELGNRLRRAFDLQPLPSRKKTAANNRDKFSAMSRRAASLDGLEDWRHPQEAVPDSMFGGMIGDAVDGTTGINKFVQWCIQAIETTGEGLKTDGIYRVTAGQVGAKRISWQHERSMPRVLERESNVHVLTAALRLFFKSLKQPIMRVEDFKIAMQPHLNDMETAEFLRQVVYSLPLAERSTIAYLFLHLKRVVDVKENNMTLATLSASFGPTLLRLRTEFAAQASMAKDMKQQNRLVGQLLLHSEAIFGAAWTTDKVTGGVTDCVGVGELDSSASSSSSSDDEYVESISSVVKTPELAAAADKCKTKSTTSAKKKRTLEDKMDSSSSDESEVDSPMKQRVLIASADNYKRTSSLTSNKGSVFRDKISSSSSNDSKRESPNKKQVLGKSADSKRNSSFSSLSSNKASIFRDKISSSSSNDSKRQSPNKKQALGKSVVKKRNSSLSSIKETRVLRDKTVSSSSEEVETDSAMKEPVFSSSPSENKDVLFRDRIKTSSSDKEKSRAPVKKRALVASADVYKRQSSLSANKESVFRDKPDSSSSDEDKPKARTKQDVWFASTNHYGGNSSLPAINTDVIYQDKVESSSSDEMKHNHSDKKVKQGTSAKSIIKKMRNKLFPFRATKNKHKSSLSLNEKERSGSPIQIQQMSVDEIDAISVKPTEFVPESNTNVVSPTIMTTFKYSFAEHTDSDQKLKYRSRGVEASKVMANATENKMTDGLLRFRLISSSSSSSSSFSDDDDDNDHPATTSKLKKPAIIKTILGRIKGESTTKKTTVNKTSKTVMQTKQQNDSVTKFSGEGTVNNMPHTKSKIPPTHFQQDSFSSSYQGENLLNSAEKNPPIATEAIDITESKQNLHTSSEIEKVIDLEYTLNSTKQTHCSVTSSDEGNAFKATSFLEDMSSLSKQNVMDVQGHVSSSMNYSNKKIVHTNSPLQNRHVTVSPTVNDPTIFVQHEIYDADFIASSSPLQIASNDAVSERKENAIHATVHKLTPSAAMPQPDIFKPTPTLTEVFNSNSIHSTYYAPPLESGRETNGSVVSSNNTISITSESKFKKKGSSSSSSGESFSDSSDDYVPTSPPPPPPGSQFQSKSTAATGIRIHASVPTAL